MGVSGSGKTTVARAIAARTGLIYGEADRFHSPANIAKMSAGIPLTDADRWPWLQALGSWMAQADARGDSTVLACSALKRAYRVLLRSSVAGVQFVHLNGSTLLLRERLKHRSHHFMPVGLLQSQLHDLEPLGEDEDGLVLDASLPLDEVVARAVAALDLPTLSP
jgi:gluconokinase